MLKNHLILIPFNLPWEWSTDYTNQTAFVLAKKNIVAAYMWGDKFSVKEYLQKKTLPKIIKKQSENLYLFYPTQYIPFKRFRLIRNINQDFNLFLFRVFVSFLEYKNNSKGKIIWIFDPNTRFIIDYLDKSWKVIYDCVDFWSATGKTEKEKKIIERTEKDLTIKADLVTAISKVLQKHLQKYRQDVYLVPQGFRLQDFENQNNYIAPKIKAKKPIIGFAGAVNHRLDYNLLLPLAKRNPNWSFVIWGPVLEEEKIPDKVKQMKRKLLTLPNVSTGFLKERKKLPGIFKQFDISIIPYDISQDFNKYCYPMKLFEFFYLGKPVISTEIEELKRFPEFVKIGKDKNEWQEILVSLTNNPWPERLKKRQKKLAEENSWEKKINTITSSIEW